jgi:hypothetical protein
VPGFFDDIWFMSGEKYETQRDWYVYVGRGGNIRNAETPVPLTKMMAHHMMLAPDDSNMEGAIRWGQIHALGGDYRLVEAIWAHALLLIFRMMNFGFLCSGSLSTIHFWTGSMLARSLIICIIRNT